MEDFIKFWLFGFFALAAVSTLLFYAFAVDLIQWYWKLIIVLIMFGVPAYFFFKQKKDE